MIFVSNRDQVYAAVSSSPQTASEIAEKISCGVRNVYKFLDRLRLEGKIKRTRDFGRRYSPYVYSKS
jgi:hypothetical protein